MNNGFQSKRDLVPAVSNRSGPNGAVSKKQRGKDIRRTFGINAGLAMKAGRVSQKRVLVVEDEAEVREAIRRLLSADRHTVVEAANGIEGLDLFTREKFDLVIVNFHLPGMMGDKLIARIKQMVPGQPVILITAFGETLGSLEIRADYFLDKPFGIEALREAVAKLLS
jgi:CheY-like chemotaxis protein